MDAGTLDATAPCPAGMSVMASTTTNTTWTFTLISTSVYAYIITASKPQCTNDSGTIMASPGTVVTYAGAPPTAWMLWDPSTGAPLQQPLPPTRAPGPPPPPYPAVNSTSQVAGPYQLALTCAYGAGTTQQNASSCFSADSYVNGTSTLERLRLFLQKSVPLPAAASAYAEMQITVANTSNALTTVVTFNLTCPSACWPTASVDALVLQVVSQANFVAAFPPKEGYGNVTAYSAVSAYGHDNRGSPASKLARMTWWLIIALLIAGAAAVLALTFTWQRVQDGGVKNLRAEKNDGGLVKVINK